MKLKLEMLHSMKDKVNHLMDNVETRDNPNDILNFELYEDLYDLLFKVGLILERAEKDAPEDEETMGVLIGLQTLYEITYILEQLPYIEDVKKNVLESYQKGEN